MMVLFLLVIATIGCKIVQGDASLSEYNHVVVSLSKDERNFFN
jgi:hypothetical protein